MTSDLGAAHGARNSGMPLGGIGAGSVELRPDGYFYRWYVMNNYEWAAGPHTTVMEREGLRFGMLCRGAASGQRRHFALGKDYGLDPIPDGWFWTMDPYHIPWVQHAGTIDYVARIPFAQLAYHFEQSPLLVTLEATSPLVPYDVGASNTPGLTLRFTVRNVSHEAQHVSFWGLLKNAVGYDRPELPGAMRFDGALRQLVMTRQGLPAEHVTAGEMALAVDVAAACAARVTCVLHPRHGRDIWDPLEESGCLENADFGVGKVKVGEVGAEKTLEGPTGHRRGALCADFDLPAGASCDVTFTVSWFFPNMCELSGGQGTGPGPVIGHYYANRFQGAADVVAFLRREGGSLAERSRRFVDDFFATSLPAWELDAIHAQLSPLLRTAWLDKRGRFGMWEGIGRCGLQTVDVSHYANFLAMQLWPQLDESQQRLVMANTNRAGKVPHTMHGVFADGEKNCDKRIDLCSQFALAIWRYTLWTGDLALARDAWPVIVRNLQILEAADTDGDGLPNAVGRDQTYDKFDVVGSSALINFGYVPALMAASELAAKLGDEKASRTYGEKAKAAMAAAEKQLWNGSYYDLSLDPASGKRNSGCLTDQFNGFWFYQQTCGRPGVDAARVQSVCSAILTHNARREGPAAWVANCTWPNGGVIPFERNGSDQANSPWSGVEYAFAAYLVLNGMREEGRKVARDVFERYERAGMRFDHYECGEYYHRGLAAFAIYNAEFGVHYDGFAKTLRVRQPAEDAQFLVVLPTGYGIARYTTASGELKLETRAGTLDVQRVELV